MRLAGLKADKAFIDPTYLHFSGFADNKNYKWDKNLCQLFKIEIEKLPEIVSSFQVIGELTGSMAQRCGLKPGIPIVAGCGDTAASFLACGAVEEGIGIDVAGTASVFAATTQYIRSDMKHRTLGCAHSAVPGLWHPYAYINGGGMNLEWFKDNIISVGNKNNLNFEQLNSRIQNLKLEKDNPVFIPHLGGRVAPSRPFLRGAWINLNWKHNWRHLYQSMLEAVALEYGIYLQILKELYPKLRWKEIRITGGGEKSHIWNKIKASVLNVPVVRVINSKGAPMGAAILAGLGAGIFKDIHSVTKAWIKKSRQILPDKKMTGYYQAKIEKYKDMLKILEEYSKKYAK